MCRTVPTTNNYLCEKISSAVIEKACVMLSKRRQTEKYLFYYPSLSSRTGEISMVKKLTIKFAFLKDKARIHWEENERYFRGEGSVLY